MRINHKVLNIPPYLSTSWNNVLSLQAERQGSSYTLVVTLTEGSRVEVPDLEQAIVDTIFAAHARFHEIEHHAQKSPVMPVEGMAGLPVKFGLGLEGLGPVLQHNQEQYDSPDLPIEVLNKISQLTKTMGFEEFSALPKPEPHCNCPHCQIAKAIQQGASEGGLVDEAQMKNEPTEEEVSDADLRFRTWDIVQTSEKLYTVSNPIDNKEYYNVFLGSPVGCTCGSKNCEHIKAVLNT